MKLWIVRTKQGNLQLHQIKPIWLADKGKWFSNYELGYIYGEYFPEVTFENSPQEVELKLVE